MVAKDLRGGGSFNLSFLCRSFLNLRLENYWSILAKVIAKTGLLFSETWCKMSAILECTHNLTGAIQTESSIWYLQ